MANFGHIPYGQTLLGRLYFNKENPTGCNPNKTFTDVFNSDPDLNL